jgi:hypothetical protein
MTTDTDFESIKAAAIALINDPNRKFGRAFSHTLHDVVGAALVAATEPLPLASQDFEKARSEILKSFRNPASPSRLAAGRAC